MKGRSGEVSDEGAAAFKPSGLIGTAEDDLRTSGRLNSVLRRMLGLLPLILPILILIPGLSSFPFPPGGASYSDFAISHYPNALYLQQALLKWHTVPFWSPTILGGYPFAANPLSGLWYFPGWLALAFPLPLGINIVLLLHWLLAGAGLYWLLRAEGLGRPAALFGALAFEALPKLFAHYGAGHVSLIYAISWTPWLLLSARAWILRPRGWLSSGISIRLVWALPAIVMALILLADVRWSVYAAILLVGYMFSLRWSPRRGTISSVSAGRSFLNIAGWLGLAVLLAAPLLAPMLEYTLLSTRSSLKPIETMVYSLPPARLLGLIFPDPAGIYEFTLYSGIVVLALSVLALICHSSRKGAAIWALFAILGLILALGKALPLAPALAELPFFGWLRVPSRALFITGLSLAALSAWGVNTLLSSPTPTERRRSSLFLAGLAGFTIMMALIASFVVRETPIGFLWGAMVSLAAAAWIGLKLKDCLSDRLWILGLFGLCLIDLLLMDLSLFKPRPAHKVLSEGVQAAEYLQAQPGVFRTYSPSYSLPQQTGAIYGIQLADGVDPLQLKAYAVYMEQASGVPVESYSVTLPPFESGDPATANQSYIPDANLLGRLNVGYILAEYDLQAEGLELLQRFGETRLYKNLKSRPRAWVTLQGEAGGDHFVSVNQLEWSPRRVVIQAKGPGVLTLSEINYPGWQVRLDGQQIERFARESLLRAVKLPAGIHTAEWIFRPTSVTVGMGLAAFGLLLIGIIAWATSSGGIQHETVDPADRKGMTA